MSKIINADVIYASWLSNHIGPSRSLTRFSNNKAFFLKSGINLEIYSQDKIIHRNFETINQSPFQRLRQNLINIFLKAANFNSRLTEIVLNKKYLSHSKRIVEYYLNQQRSADVLVFHELFTCYEYLKKVKDTGNRKPIILFHHANGETFKMLKIYHPQLKSERLQSVLSEIENFTLSKIDKYAFISDNARKHFLALNQNFPAKKTAFFHNGIENITIAERKSKLLESGNDSRIRLICVGTINNRKGQKLLLETFLSLSKEERENYHITFIGNGPEKPLIQSIVESKGLEDSILLVGSVNNVDSYLLNSHVFILPSRDEGLPISIIEAMRAELPIIGTNVAGIPEMIEDGVSGLIVEPNVRNIKDALLKIKDMNIQSMGKRSREIFEEKFTLETMMSNYSKIIRETHSC